MFASLSGTDELDRQLATLPAALMAKIDAKTRELAEALAVRVREQKLSGQVLQTRSGALKASIVAEVANDGETITASVGSVGDIKYAAIQEYGGRTAAHDILPDKAQALAFIVGGGLRFARHVHHPGSTLPARGYLSSALAEQQAEIVAELTDAAAQAWSHA
jgi:phage gpG-like protein